MTDIEIVNPLPRSEIVSWFANMATAFLEDPATFTADADARAATWDLTRGWGARAGGRWVATLRTMPRTITVPHSSKPLMTDALTNVTVAATHRRRGLLTTMLTDSLQAAKDRGDAVSILVAAEWPIYGRFGYAPASDIANYTVHTRQPGSRLLEPASGSVRQVEAEQMGEIARTVFAAAWPARAGNIDRDDYWWNREFGLNDVPRGDSRAPVYIVHEGPNGVDGYLTWYSTGNWTLSGDLGEVTVRDLTAVDEHAYRALWHYLFSLDVVEKVHLRDRPIDELLPWLLVDGRTVRQHDRVDFMWLRILDVAVALSTRGYAAPGEIVLDVVDREGAGVAEGRYRLESAPASGTECERTTREPQLRLNQRALAAIYLGGSSWRAQAQAGLVEELQPGAVARADAMFATPLAPWCSTGF